MIKFDDILNLIERCKVPYVRITDAHGNKIIDVENTTVSATVTELQDLEPMLKSYGKLSVSATNDAGAKANYKGAYKWVMYFEKPGTPQIPGISGLGWGMGAPPGYVSTDVMNAKLETIQKENEWNKKFAELEKKITGGNEIDKYIGYAPMLMSMLGHDDAKIEKMVKWHVMTSNKPGTVAFVPPTNTLTFKDVEAMTPEQKNEKIQTLLDSLSSKVSAEHMILLLEAIDKKPELAEKAVGMLSML